MSRYIRNALAILSDDFDINLLLSKDDEENKYFDFNKIIEMPKELDDVYEDEVIRTLSQISFSESYTVYDLIEMLRKYYMKSNDNEIMLEHICNLIKNKIKYKFYSWHEWSINNWGTPFNSFNTKIINKKEMLFDTDCSPPLIVYQKLHEKYQELKISAIFASDNIGVGCGMVYIEDDNLIVERIEDRCNEAYDLASILYPERKDENKIDKILSYQKKKCSKCNCFCDKNS